MYKDIKEFVENLKQRPDVLGIILFGSWACGNNRSDSDVDLVVIQKEGHQRAIDRKGQLIFEIIYTTDKLAFDYWDSHKDDCAGLWDTAKIMYDKDGSIEKLKNKVTKEILKKGKKEINELQLGQLLFDAEDQLNYTEKIINEDSITANLILNNKVFSLTELFFNIQQLWVPAPKQRLGKIKELNPELHKLLEGFYAKSQSFAQRLEIARKITNLIFKK